MQRDTEQTFGEIHGSVESLISEVESIIDVALIRTNDDGPLKLRFLKPLDASGLPTTDRNVKDLELTTLDVHTPGLAYISVSYCWKHVQSSEGLEVPKYRIWDRTATNAAHRPNRCPPLVLHRALQFAQLVDCLYIWIDQECIDQDDTADVERHLKIMHRVYRSSRWTIAVLSESISDINSLESLVELLQHPIPLVKSDGEVVKVALEFTTLTQITADRWFTRTWAFQEKECATSLQLLVPVDPKLTIPDEFKSLVPHHDLCLPMERITAVLTELRHGHHGSRLARWIWHNDSLFDHNLGHLGIWYGKVGHSTDGHGSSPWQQDNHLLHGAFHMMEKCDNLVVADRISIYGNVCQLPFRLLSNRLSTQKYSYSTCLLALLLANFYPQARDRVNVVSGHAWLLQHHNISTVIEDDLFYLSDEEREFMMVKDSPSMNRSRGIALFLILAFLSLPFLHVALHFLPSVVRDA